MEKRSQPKNSGRGRTRPEGQNPKADDSPEHDVHRDDTRRNMYDPEVGEALKDAGRKGGTGE